MRGSCTPARGPVVIFIVLPRCSSNDAGAATRFLHECVPYQRAIDACLDSLLTRRVDIDRAAASLLHSVSPVLSLTASDAAALLLHNGALSVINPCQAVGGPALTPSRRSGACALGPSRTQSWTRGGSLIGPARSRWSATARRRRYDRSHPPHRASPPRRLFCAALQSPHPCQRARRRRDATSPAREDAFPLNLTSSPALAPDVSNCPTPTSQALKRAHPRLTGSPPARPRPVQQRSRSGRARARAQPSFDPTLFVSSHKKLPDTRPARRVRDQPPPSRVEPWRRRPNPAPRSCSLYSSRSSAPWRRRTRARPWRGSGARRARLSPARRWPTTSCPPWTTSTPTSARTASAPPPSARGAPTPSSASASACATSPPSTACSASPRSAADAGDDVAVCGSSSAAAEGGRNYTGGAGPRAFGAAVRAALENVTADAAAPGSRGFGAGSAASGGATAFALAQCWESLNATACAQCLRAASGAVAACAPATEGRALFTGCYLRYSTRRFWNANATAGAGSGSSGNKGVVWILVGSFLGAFAVVLIISFLAWKKRILRRKNEWNSFIDMYGDGLSVRIAQSSLNFKYEELRKATNYFDPSNKLGQGSYGAVYKAVLLDGKEVAVKRLFLNTRQWVDQFFNEVDLISQVRHKNLVKLLGCSMNGPESLLVYEYYFNKSLDLFLFDTSGRRNLTWDLRIDIIQGIAEGLSYLHEESETRIIHRDIKASNILLDDKLKPKITDFGLARAFGEDVTHLTTGVAGTLGYMAPEYIVHGHLTEKADVFSYGVLVLEIVTGKRCSSSNGSHGGQVLLTKVWKHYKDNTVEMIVDRSIYEDTIRDEAMHILQIGLLCTQANPDDRPTMGKVVELLRNHRNDLEIVLSDPPFLDVEAVENIKEGEHSRLLSTNSAPSLSGSSRSYLSGR
nr:cysteine-rich receptor-like protein kinase 2 [Setaria viridis]